MSATSQADEVQANKVVIEHHFQAFNERNYELMKSVTSPEMVHHATLLVSGPTEPRQRRPPEPMRGAFLFLCAAFPDLKFTTEDMIGEGESVVARVRQQGTHRWKFQGAAATGQFTKFSRSTYSGFGTAKRSIAGWRVTTSR